MQAILMNFGDNTRVVNTVDNTPILIGIGKIVECDIHEVHYNMVRRAIRTDTLMVVPKSIRQSPRLRAVMDLLEAVNSEQYDVLLQRYNECVPETGENLRPTRDQIRIALRDTARHEVAQALQLQSKVTIREEGDEVTRQPVPTSETHTLTAPAPQPPAPTPKKKARSRRSEPKASVPTTKVKRERL